ncbi:MAG: 2Fe-2S iron-sulfur cluster binding domain-containing protein, partial [Chloroflexi bacterium]|nr:2Fe-2S iron-sulfur cluster binding domain-containing protein [Chloroflexota bacterium]
MPEGQTQKYLVVFQPSGRRGYIEPGQTLKQASRELGVDIEGICGDVGTCGTCKVRVEDGSFEKYGIESHRNHLSPLTEAEKTFINQQMEGQGYRLACQAKVRGDVVVFVPEGSRMGQQIVRKAARDIAIEVKPAVRKYYVEMAKATLVNTLGDWERMTAQLDSQFGLSDLSIDYPTLVALQEMVRQGNWQVTASVWMDREVIRVEPGKMETGYGLAIDIGTTTVASYLCDLNTGDIVATES